MYSTSTKGSDIRAVPAQPKVVKNLISVMMERIETISKLTEELRSIANDLIGEEPPISSGAVQHKEDPRMVSGSVGEVEDLAHRMGDALVAISYEIERLRRL